jgi:hypothetical protein
MLGYKFYIKSMGNTFYQSPWVSDKIGSKSSILEFTHELLKIESEVMLCAGALGSPHILR